MNFTNKLRVLFTAIILIGMSFAACGQSRTVYKIEGNEIVRVSVTKVKAKPIKTDIVYKTKDSIYPVFKSVRGSYYINKLSKRSGKIYKKYLRLAK